MNYDYSIHSDFLIHWTGKDIDSLYDQQWYESNKSETNKNCNVSELYIKRLHDILKYGIWMTEGGEKTLCFNNTQISIPTTPKTCFTELKISESRKHAKQYGRLGIGVKRRFAFDRFGRPLVYYGFNNTYKKDKFLEACSKDLNEKRLLNFFKSMNSSNTLNYDFYAESEWRIVYFRELLSQGLIIDPRDSKNEEEHEYFCTLSDTERNKLQYLIPLDGWFAMIIYPSLEVKNRAQQDTSTGIREQIKRIKEKINDYGNEVEGKNWPIEIDLDVCRNF